MRITRRSLLSAFAVGLTPAFLDRNLFSQPFREERAADVTLRIAQVKLDIAPGHTIATTTYNGGVSGPPIRFKEGVPATVEIMNETENVEYVHWHGFLLPAELDGTEEENSLAIAPQARLRYSVRPHPSGIRFVHSHAMAMADLSRGTYSGQFAPVYIEPKMNPGAYDQEIFLTTHEWEPYLATEEEEEALTESVLHRIMDEERLNTVGPANREVGYRIASINGKALGHGEPLRVKEGQRLLIHFVNASATENIRLALSGHRFWITALDGNTVPTPQFVDVLELGVAERIDAVVLMNHPGVWILGSTDPDMREKGLGVVIEYANRHGLPIWNEAPESTWDYTKFGKGKAEQKTDEQIPMVIDRAEPDNNEMERWSINGRSYNANDKPSALQRGRRYRLIFKNRTEEAHPLHLHRARFELANVNGKSTAGVMKDVVVVKGFQTVAVDFIPEQSGLILFHCHQQMHMDAGFKKIFKVVE